MRTAHSLIFNLIHVLTPSFYRARSSPGTAAVAAAAQHHDDSRDPLAYLHGLRGLAIFLIYTSAFCLPLHPFAPSASIIRPIDSDDDGEGSEAVARNQVLSYPPLSLPLLRLFHSGPAMISILFVTSGYLLTAPAVRLARRRAHDDLLRYFTATLVKRTLHLLLPTVLTSLATLALVCLHWYGPDRALDPSAVFPAFAQPLLPPDHPGGLWTALRHWVGFVSREVLSPFDWRPMWMKPVSLYGQHLWVVAYEFRCSLVLAAIMAVTLRMESALKRAALVVGVIVYCAVWERGDIVLFLAGHMLALHQEAGRLHDFEDDGDGKRGEGVDGLLAHAAACDVDRPRSLPVYVAWLGSLWLLSFPSYDEAQDIPGFQLLAATGISKELWHSIGAVLLVWSLGRLRLVRSLLRADPVQYLGHISLALYLIHEPVLQSWGWYLTGWLLNGEQTTSTAAVPALNYIDTQ
ncbi:hypothetical protein M406DRAFT_353173 [Cryphonectria parasitica EP155]|uniref:Acyltransferase 3 domain-containing protein n=1 Tax=Cryphonectria parasitica (strain ATCC 38755 / EP155) TaxID=660469 RepID=A0A9P4XUM1_CRYP1|nr:uncharacterized protein M406DRAFT_353173 [Cryphonectria parasitica EP155]KAF3761587.1 hypothetical protein M406DRAFT_353173 [Cryphonectria parasitica EP155]